MRQLLSCLMQFCLVEAECVSLGTPMTDTATDVACVHTRRDNYSICCSDTPVSTSKMRNARRRNMALLNKPTNIFPHLSMSSSTVSVTLCFRLPPSLQAMWRQFWVHATLRRRYELSPPPSPVGAASQLQPYLRLSVAQFEEIIIMIIIMFCKEDTAEHPASALWLFWHNNTQCRLKSSIILNGASTSRLVK